MAQPIGMSPAGSARPPCPPASRRAAADGQCAGLLLSKLQPKSRRKLGCHAPKQQVTFSGTVLSNRVQPAASHAVPRQHAPGKLTRKQLAANQ